MLGEAAQDIMRRRAVVDASVRHIAPETMPAHGLPVSLPRARTTDPETSHEAVLVADGVVARARAACYYIVAASGHTGATWKDIIESSHWPQDIDGDHAWKRLGELCADGLVKYNGTKRRRCRVMVKA